MGPYAPLLDATLGIGLEDLMPREVHYIDAQGEGRRLEPPDMARIEAICREIDELSNDALSDSPGDDPVTLV